MDRKTKSSLSRMILFGVIIAVLTQVCALAQSGNVCPRFPAGSIVTAPPDLFSNNGVLLVKFSYQTMMDQNNNTLYCFITPDGKQSPTLHVRPGDHLVITVKNDVPPPPASAPAMHHATPPGMAISAAAPAFPVCGAPTMNASSMNIHYHGTNTSPTCHSDEVIFTTVNSGETFRYDVHFPENEPPGLYWYHPHIHGIAEPAVQGGASGAIIVEGIEDVQPAVEEMAQQVLILRDNHVPGNPTPGGPNNVPSWDMSVNYIPVPYQAPPLTYIPAIIQMEAGEKQLWRVVNASADSLFDL